MWTTLTRSASVDAREEASVPGYSDKPLSKKLGLEPPLDLVLVDAPAEYASWLGELPEGVRFVSRSEGPVQAAHLFARQRAVLERELHRLSEQLEPAGFVWVSWPKQASRVATEVTEDAIREVALPLGFVDVKVCAVSEVWSGLKLVIRKELRRRRAVP
jgi:hypothetical protein